MSGLHQSEDGCRRYYLRYSILLESWRATCETLYMGKWYTETLESKTEEEAKNKAEEWLKRN